MTTRWEQRFDMLCHLAPEPEDKQTHESLPVRGKHGGPRSRSTDSSGPVCCRPVGPGPQAVLAAGSRDNSGLPCCHRCHPPPLRGRGHPAVPGGAGLHAQSGARGEGRVAPDSIQIVVDLLSAAGSRHTLK